ncbi:M24 family metallopeptidase [Nonomuraea sp. NBC_01738]|uniref:M24 family metallopeptidase n=1 Tax=Nonomuraea sp. NBC_01738 TaxID=2976003 RepID=UPI003FA35610|nr:M24 family metallopeptidase [Nonomuraea sp. NBC_01738]
MVLAAQQAAFQAVRQALPAAGVAATAGQIVDDSGYGLFAAPHCGRGVGLGHDEPPRLAPAETIALEPGMAVCVEPAVYVPDLFGARLADVVVCTEDGPLALTSPPHVMTVLDH